MNVSTSQTRRLAKHLMDYERLRNKSSEGKNPAAFQVTDRLRPHLTTLMGNGGFRALLSRALALANAEIPWLRAVHVKADGSLEGLAELHGQLDPEKFTEGRIVLLAHLLGLLVALIGPNLTWNLLGDIWPQISRLDIDFTEARHEKAK